MLTLYCSHVCNLEQKDKELEKLVPLLWKDVSSSPLTDPQYAGNSCSPERCCDLVVHV